jgi:hypothetical protein
LYYAINTFYGYAVHSRTHCALVYIDKQTAWMRKACI